MFFFHARFFLTSLCITTIFFLSPFFIPSLNAADYPKILTSDEVAWLEATADKPVRYVIPPKFPPVSFIKEGEADGIVKSYLQILEKRLGLHFQLQEISFKDGLALAKKGEVDFFPCLGQSADREAFLDFTSEPYLAFQLVIVSRKNGEPIRGIQDLDGKKVAVDKNLVAYSKLKNEHADLDIEFVFVKTNPNAVKAVHLSQADAALTNSAVAGYLIAENGWNNLKIAADTGWPEVRMKMAVKKEWPLFRSILEKTLAEIPDEARLEISNQWIPIHIEHGFDSIYVLKRILPIIGGFAAIAVVVSLFLMMMIKKNRQLQEAEQKIQAAYEEVEAARAVAEAASKAKGEFLDNSGQGFLSFGDDLIVDSEYSHECELIFEEAVAGKNICDLLFPDFEKGAAARALFVKTAALAINDPLDLKQELYLSLLKPCYRVGKKHIKAEYHIIDGPKMMLILTDITREKRLEKDVENERQLLKFVVAAVRDAKDLFSMIEDFDTFKRGTLTGIAEDVKTASYPLMDLKGILTEIYRSVHTFKGIFAQQEFIDLPPWLHDMESRLSEMMLQDPPAVDPFLEFIADFQNESVLERDLTIIRSYLGEDFLVRKSSVVLGQDEAMKLEEMARRLLNADGPLTLPSDRPSVEEGTTDDNLLYQLLLKISCIRYVPLPSLLDGHVDGVLRYAKKIGKRIAPFKIEGDPVPVDPKRLTALTKSLVHVFRNALDHGIETPDDRMAQGKLETAVIHCSVRKIDGPMEHVEITIGDDGRGIDFHAIERRAVERGLMTLQEVKQASEEALMHLIFSSGFSTASEIGTLSGRGVGLNAVKHEVERLNGKIEVKTDNKSGTQFIFTIPM